MKRISSFLTGYVIRKGLVSEEDREVYEYGFTVTLEVGIFAVLCIIIMGVLHMYLEGILFFVIFAPLRSYAGGLHLQKYYACLTLSTLTFVGILLIAGNIQLPLILINVVSLISLSGIYILYPVENANRAVDQEEDRYFRKKLLVYLVLDVTLIVLFNFLHIHKSIMVIALTLLMVFVTMILGKCANSLHKPSFEEGK